MRRLGDILHLENADGALAAREIAGLASDSRKALPGDIFFALAGASDDGLAHAAPRFFPRQPETIVAVTGTSGKTSVAAFARQIWQTLGRNSASLGTLG